MKNFEKINIETGMYDLRRAHEVAKILREGEECGWTYTVVPVGNGSWGRIDVHEATGELVVEGMIFDDGHSAKIFV
jgi:hypothetical protein